MSVLFLSTQCDDDFDIYNDYVSYELKNQSEEDIYVLTDFAPSPDSINLKKYDFNNMEKIKAGDSKWYSYGILHDIESMYVKILIVKESNLSKVTDSKDTSLFDKEIIVPYKKLESANLTVIYDGKE